MTNYAVQEQNQDLVSLLAAHFRLLYNPVHAFSDAISMLQMFPGIVGIWPGSLIGTNGELVDTLNRLPLINNGSSNLDASGLVAFRDFNGTTRYYSRTDEALFDVTGTEGYVVSTKRGLTLGAWIFPTTTGSIRGVVSKWNTESQRSYLLQKNASESLQVVVSTDGSTSVSRTHSGTVNTNTWNFAAMRFEPSAALGVWSNGDYEESTTSIPASIFNSTATFNVGAINGASLFSGRMCLVFLCAAAVPDVFINTYFQMTAPLFNVSI